MTASLNRRTRCGPRVKAWVKSSLKRFLASANRQSIVLQNLDNLAKIVPKRDWVNKDLLKCVDVNPIEEPGNGTITSDLIKKRHVLGNQVRNNREHRSRKLMDPLRREEIDASSRQTERS